jgi:hypothetical protein
MVMSKDFPIVAPYFVGWEMAGDDDYCKLARHQNQWLCYFLPMTNCTVALRDHVKATDDLSKEEIIEEMYREHELAYIIQGKDPSPTLANSPLLAKAGIIGIGGMMDTADVVATATKPIKLEGLVPAAMADEKRMPKTLFDAAGGPHGCGESWCADYSAAGGGATGGAPAHDIYGKGGCCDRFANQGTEGLDLDAFLAFQLLYRLSYRSRAVVAQIRYEFAQAASYRPESCTSMHIRRTDKVTGKCLVDPFNPAYQQLPGFNRTFANYIENAEGLMKVIV